MSNTIWYVTAPESNEPMTIISETEADAIKIARDINDDPDPNSVGYEVSPGQRETHLSQSMFRWIGFESLEDADDQIRALGIAEANFYKVRRRVHQDADGTPLVWEVGAPDSEWVKLPSGYLCGGEC